MAIELKLADEDTPQPWQAAAEEAAPLDYARHGLPSAPPRTIARTLWAILKRLLHAFGWLVGGGLLVAAFALLVAATIIRFAFAGGAALLLLIRRVSPSRMYHRLRWGGRVIDAQVA